MSNRERDHILANVAAAIRKLATVSSHNLGRDCYLHAAITRELLARLGIEARLVVGFAAWRVGEGDGDVVLHAPLQGQPIQPGALPYHVWLELAGGLIFDPTTYQLREKAAQLDALDGGKTTVEWCPEYLLLAPAEIFPLGRVIQERAGMCFYQREERLEQEIQRRSQAADEEDVALAWLIYQNPEMALVGPFGGVGGKHHGLSNQVGDLDKGE